MAIHDFPSQIAQIFSIFALKMTNQFFDKECNSFFSDWISGWTNFRCNEIISSGAGN